MLTPFLHEAKFVALFQAFIVALNGFSRHALDAVDGSSTGT
jgi:hypothetical protein